VHAGAASTAVPSCASAPTPARPPCSESRSPPPPPVLPSTLIPPAQLLRSSSSCSAWRPGRRFPEGASLLLALLCCRSLSLEYSAAGAPAAEAGPVGAAVEALLGAAGGLSVPLLSGSGGSPVEDEGHGMRLEKAKP